MGGEGREGRSSCWSESRLVGGEVRAGPATWLESKFVGGEGRSSY